MPRKKWKGRGWEKATILVADDQGTEYRSLSRSTIRLLLTALETASWATRWDIYDAEVDAAVRLAAKELMVVVECGDGSMYFLRQNPDNPCQLEQSQDGVTWSLAFDYSLCGQLANGAADLTIYNTVSIFRDLYLGSYNPGDVAPNFVNAMELQRTICVAMEWWVRAVLAGAKQRRIGKDSRNAIVSGIIALVGVGISWATGGLSTLLAAVIAGAILYQTAENIEAIEVNEYDDTNTMREIWCCAADYLYTNGITFAYFQTSFENCRDVEPDTLKNRMIDILADAATLDPFLGFLRLGDEASFLTESFNLDCDCPTEPVEEPTLVHTFSVAANNSQYQGTYTLTGGEVYRIDVIGDVRTHVLYSGWKKDAQFDTTDSFVNDRRRVNNVQFADGSKPTAQDSAYSATHTYSFVRSPANNEVLKLRVVDSNYGDNSETWTVNVYLYP